MFNGTTDATIDRFDEDTVMYRLSKTKLLRYITEQLNVDLPDEMKKDFLTVRGINKTLQWC
jgi:hypothetical protein